jgi:hypothetical protein
MERSARAEHQDPQFVNPRFFVKFQARPANSAVIRGHSSMAAQKWDLIMCLHLHARALIGPSSSPPRRWSRLTGWLLLTITVSNWSSRSRQVRAKPPSRFASFTCRTISRSAVRFWLKRRWVGFGEIPDGHRWDSLPKIRFAPDSPLEGAGFEPSVPRDTTKFRGRLMSLLLDSPHAEKSARTRTDTTRMRGASRGTDGSNPAPSSGESCKPDRHDRS